MDPGLAAAHTIFQFNYAAGWLLDPQRRRRRPARGSHFGVRDHASTMDVNRIF
jgi:hypothetical protein